MRLNLELEANKKFILVASEETKKTYKGFLSSLKNNLLSEKEDSKKAQFLVLGGDGTLNYFVNHYSINNGDEVLYLPTGTANDFAKSLKLSNVDLDFFNPCSVIESKFKVKIPLMLCNNRYFLNVASCGGPAEVTNSGEDLLKSVTGKLSYYLNGIEKMVSPQSFEVNYDLFDGKGEMKQTTDGFIISQGLFAGGGIKVSESFSPNFGDYFNFILAQNVSVPEVLKDVIELQKNEVGDLPSLESLYLKKLKVKSQKAIPAKIDGEEVHEREYEFKKSDVSLTFYLY